MQIRKILCNVRIANEERLLNLCYKYPCPVLPGRHVERDELEAEEVQRPDLTRRTFTRVSGALQLQPSAQDRRSRRRPLRAPLMPVLV